MRSTKISFDIFIEIIFAFLVHLLIENFKQETCFEETIGFDVAMATILSHMKPCSTTRITIIGYSIQPHSVNLMTLQN